MTFIATKGALWLTLAVALSPLVACSPDAVRKGEAKGYGVPNMSAGEVRFVYFYDDILTLLTQYHGYVTKETFEKVFQVKFSKVVRDKDGGYVATLEGGLDYGVSVRLQVSPARDKLQRWERSIGARTEPRSVLNISSGILVHDMSQAELRQKLKDQGFHELGRLQGTNMVGAKTVFAMPDRAGTFSFYSPTMGISSGQISSLEIVGYDQPTR